MGATIPARWYAGGKGLDQFREQMLSDKHIRVMIDYPKSRECFQGVDIAGGVCYFLWDRDNPGNCDFTSIQKDKINRRKRCLNEFNILIRDNIGVDIINKINTISNNSLFFSDIVLPRNSFGFTTSARGKNKPFSECIKLISSEGVSYIKKGSINKNSELVKNYKVSIGTLNPDRGGVNNASDGKMNVTTKIKLLLPNEVVTETYIIIHTFPKKQEAENCVSYFRTKFVRYLISLTISSMHIVRDNFQFVPLQDFSEPWTDEKLYKKYKLTKDEIAFIESMIRPMEIDGE